MADPSDLITDVRNSARPNSARVTTARDPDASNLACNDLTGWPEASKVHFVTYQIDTNNNPIGTSQLDCSGIRSGNTLTEVQVLDGIDGGCAIGDVVEMLPTASWGQDLADALTSEHNRLGEHNEQAAISLLPYIGNLLFPVGSIYSNIAVSTNPATLLGFGTWVALESRVLVGRAASGTFNVAAGSTGGAESHTLTMNEIPTHGLTMSHHGDEGGSVVRQFSANGGTTSQINYLGQYRTSSGPIGGSASYQSPTATWGGGASHNNLQPYTVVYMWKRTA